jgi:hypothetical protein
MEKNMSANFAKAVESLQKAQQEFETPHKDMTNAYLGNKYASLDSCISAIKPALHNNGFALVQSGGKDELGHFVDTKFVHITGEIFSSKIYLELDKNNMQGVGSAVTYAKRYGLLSLSGMEPDENPDDDDGNKASGTKPKKSSIEQKTEKPPAPQQESSGNLSEKKEETSDDGLDL